jgi:type IV pilus assembly protein PilW
MRGLSLIELMVAMTLGGFLIFGATQVYVESRQTYAINETTARLQENAAYALNMLEPDIRMANYWGLAKGAGLIGGQSAQAEASGGGPDDCGINYARDLSVNVEGSNNEYTLGCDAYGAGAIATADTLTVRRAASAIAEPEAERLQICSTRLVGRLFSDGSECDPAPVGQVNNLVVNTYYVDRDSVQRAGVPALRQHHLVDGGEFRDDEIISGVEDLQVQFGIDTSGRFDGTATHYVNADAVPENASIVAVRLWLLVRSDVPEAGFTDNIVYEYGDRSEANGITADLNNPAHATFAYAPRLSTDASTNGVQRYRRLLVAKTIQIRNALTF